MKIDDTIFQLFEERFPDSRWQISKETKEAIGRGETIIASTLTVSVEKVAGVSCKLSIAFRRKDNTPIVSLALPWIDKGNFITVMPLEEALQVVIK
jgi:hypothetical protein